MTKYEVSEEIDKIISKLQQCRSPKETTASEMVIEYWEIVDSFPVDTLPAS